MNKDLTCVIIGVMVIFVTAFALAVITGMI